MQGLTIVTYNLHLESRSDDDLRAAQLNEVLQHAATYDSARLLILAGDFNLNASKPQASELLARAVSAMQRPRHVWLPLGTAICWNPAVILIGLSCEAPRNQMPARF
ncbi:MAG TPA: hypothetical protein VLL05_15075 [Terriglobales bacterium]|nr:hypothetical protein [Terriglobales bacterium]